MRNFETFNLEELSKKEMRDTNGGVWWLVVVGLIAGYIAGNEIFSKK